MTSNTTPGLPSAMDPAAPKTRRQRKPAQWRQAFAPKNLADTMLVGYLPILIALLIIVLPLAWMVLSSFKPPHEIVTLDPAMLPQDPTLDNYGAVANRVPLLTVLGNSVIVTVIGATIKVILAITTAYALVFIRVPGVNLIFLGILVALMVPPEVSMLPNYLTISGLGGRNTLWGIILPGLGTAFGTFLLRQHFMALPKEMFEAAELDGAGHLRKLVQIAVPVSIPAIATVALVTIVNEWNNFLWPLIIIDSPDKMTLPVGLNLLQSIESQTGSYGILMAGAVLVIIPVLIIFAALQRYIVAGLTQGAVK